MFLSSVVLLASCGSKAHDEAKEEEHGHEDHVGEIVMTKHQMEDAHVMTAVVNPSDFVNVIKVGGQIVSSQNDEQTVVATSEGIVQFANRQLTEGATVVAGQIVATVSSRNLQSGDPVAKAKAAYLAAQSQLERAKELVADKIISQKAY